MRFQSAQVLAASWPAETSYTLVRCLKAYNKLQALLQQTLDGLSKRVSDEFTHNCDLDIRLVEVSLEVTTKDARIQDLGRQLAELQLARNEGLHREAQLEDQEE